MTTLDDARKVREALEIAHRTVAKESLQLVIDALFAARRIEALAGAELVYVIFDGPPSHDAGRFVEVETAKGKSVRAGEWAQDGAYWKLGPFYASPLSADAQSVRVPRERLLHWLEYWNGNHNERAMADALAFLVSEFSELLSAAEEPK